MSGENEACELRAGYDQMAVARRSQAERRSQAWRPFRSYTVLHLWGALDIGDVT